MARPSLTIDEARNLPFKELIERANVLLDPYDKPTNPETPGEQIARLERTLDEVPDLYRWFLHLESYFDHWTDAMADQFGMKSNDYKSMRERRDAMERVAKAAKLRYEGASRIVTMRAEFDTEGMPRGRGG